MMGASPFAAIGRGTYDVAEQRRRAGQSAQPQPASMGPASAGPPKSVGQSMTSSPMPQRPAYGTPRIASGQAMPRPAPPRQRPAYGGGYGMAGGRSMERGPEPVTRGGYDAPGSMQPSMGGYARPGSMPPRMPQMAPPPEPGGYPSLAGMEMGRGPEMVDDGYQDDLQAERLRMMMAQRQRGGYY